MRNIYYYYIPVEPHQWPYQLPIFNHFTPLFQTMVFFLPFHLSTTLNLNVTFIYLFFFFLFWLFLSHSVTINLSFSISFYIYFPTQKWLSLSLSLSVSLSLVFYFCVNFLFSISFPKKVISLSLIHIYT